MKALIDGDIVTFSCAVYNEDYGWDAARSDIDDMMKRILETTGATDYAAYITGSNNFRYTVDPEYKANRKGKPDPRYRQDANAYLVTEYGAIVTDGIEADDALGIAASTHHTKTIICSIDKDLLMIPGDHYNWRKNEFTFVTPLDGLRSFYRSFLIGDVADNITGVRGLGPVKSARLINDLEDEVNMFSVVQSLYNDDARLLRNGRLLYIHRREQDDWQEQFIKLREQAALQDDPERE
jgi:5'-3' exonuclease